MRIEAEVLVAEAAHCPQHVPAVFHYDARMCIIAMQVSAACVWWLQEGLAFVHCCGAREVWYCPPRWAQAAVRPNDRCAPDY